MPKTPSNIPDTELRTELWQQTAQISWKELQRHFARGVVLVVDGKADLIEVGLSVIKDDKKTVENWMHKKTLAAATTDDAKDWEARDPVLWAVVAAPWVLVQERESN